MDLKTFYTSKKVKFALWALVFLAVLLFVFQAGVTVGINRANFSGHLGDTYARMFDGGRPEGMIPGQANEPLGYGTSGKVLSVANGTVTVSTSDNLEKIVKVTSDTIIRKSHDQATTTDLKAGDSIVVVGAPDAQGEIDARLIRIVPTQ
jgi:hypothetical protein